MARQGIASADARTRQILALLRDRRAGGSISVDTAADAAETFGAALLEMIETVNAIDRAPARTFYTHPSMAQIHAIEQHAVENAIVRLAHRVWIESVE